MMPAEKLRVGLAELALDLSEDQQKQLLDYLAMIVKWNKVYNLTAIRDADEMLTHHLLDSLAVITPLRRHLGSLQADASKACRLLDVGAGAGLPGVVIAICCPHISVRGVHARVEQMLPADVKSGFDVITSRAFATLEDFVGLTASLLTPNSGAWMAMKAKTANTEAAALPGRVSVFHVEQLCVPDLNEDRCLVWMRVH
jgi:16S rRNA (guanine527-N7)-methyltransferase